MGRLVVTIWGHSFVVSLTHFLRNKQKHSSFQGGFPSFCAWYLQVSDLVAEVHLIGVNGGKITQNLHIPTSELLSLKPDIVIIEVGSNDAALSKTTINEIACQIIDHAESIRDLFHVSKTVVCSLIKREMGIQMSAQSFFRKIYGINGVLRRALSNQQGIKFHHHKGFWREADGRIGDTTEFSFDGIHPNRPEGRRKYIKSITAAIRNAARDLRH